MKTRLLLTALALSIALTACSNPFKANGYGSAVLEHVKGQNALNAPDAERSMQAPRRYGVSPMQQQRNAFWQ